MLPFAKFFKTCLLLSSTVLLIPAWAEGPEPWDRPGAIPQLKTSGTGTSGESFLSRAVWAMQRTDLQLTSSASCASSACHGGPRPSISNPFSEHGSEYPIWLANDPHAQSWRTLCSDASLAMLQRLNITRDAEIVDQTAYDNCLACHNTTRKYDEPRSREFHAEGVGCASCHGPSELWRSLHFQSTSRDLTHAVGLIDNGNLLVRARACAACHVGDRDRDMNHDMIAAGHPALRYEFATYHARLPKHWRDGRSEKNDFEAQLWIAGQIAGLDAELSLLQARAEKHLPVSQWPELATSNCSACHQKLRIAPARDPEGSLDYPASFTAAQVSVVLPLLQQRVRQDEAGNQGAQLFSALTHLQMILQESAVPDRVRVAKAAVNARALLDMWLGSDAGRSEIENFTAERLLEFVVALANEPETKRQWERSTQFYLAAMASRASWTGPQAEPAVASARELRAGLLFDAGSRLLANADAPQRDIPGKVQRLAAVLRSMIRQSDSTVEPGP